MKTCPLTKNQTCPDGHNAYYCKECAQYKGGNGCAAAFWLCLITIIAVGIITLITTP